MQHKEKFLTTLLFYRLAIFLFFTIQSLDSIKSLNITPFILLSGYLINAGLGYKLQNEIVQTLTISFDIILISFFEYMAKVPILVLLSLPPLFFSCTLCSPQIALIPLFIAITSNYYFLRHIWIYASVAHVCIYVASYLHFKEQVAKHQKEIVEKSKSEYQERINVLKRIARELAHEIKNPLMNISVALQTLDKSCTSQKQKHLIQLALKEIERISQLTSGFLKLDVSPVIQEKVSLQQLFNSIETRFPLVNLKVNIQSNSDSDIYLKVDPSLMEKAIGNIIQNAIEAGATKIMVTCKANGNKVIMDIKDNGHGMPEEIKEKIFMPFFSTKERGTGLGLAITKNIVEKHRGTIEVKDKNTFRIELPDE
ncbi:two-component system sensor histidine kinase [Thermosulfidibacter takaii ABI70S6]|uniref:histidine kinase n=2 Tax=Thermosulfidibacter takaii TaxID=412593 RepID=A0A0S3QTC1_THET7|nr:two-component system sensor histidine kinase [Thermosulfidibacter takaii ABI70S6]